MATESIKKMFDVNGSQLAVPVSPNPSLLTVTAINVQGNSLLHNQYSNIGAAASGYTVPGVSALGERSEAYQGETNRYKNNAPEGRSF